MSNLPFEDFSEETLTALHEWAYHYGLSLEEMAEFRGISVDELINTFHTSIIQSNIKD